MNNIRILEKSEKGWWTVHEIASVLGLKPPQTAVFCSRAVARGDLIRLKRSVYLLPGWIQKAEEGDVFYLSNILQTPSYISFSTALSFAGITTQIVRSICEAASPVRSVSFDADGFVFKFIHLPKALFFGFDREGKCFIAEPEKAFLDAAYLTSLGRYSLDFPSLNLERLDNSKVSRYIKQYPTRTKNFVKNNTELL